MKTALAMFTALPVPRSWQRADAAPAAVACLPGIGGILGALAGLPAVLLIDRRGAWLLGAALAIGALAVLTRGLHLDGLADTADGLGSGAPPQRALEIMRQSDIGPFGVITLVLVLGIDVAALASVGGGPWRPLAALAVAAATGRLAVVHACLPGVPSARPTGFGALVAGRTKPAVATAVTVAVLGGGVGLAASVHANLWGWPLAQGVALTAATALRWHTTRRFGGVTGDVFGALIETATAVTLVGLVVAG